MKNNVIIGILVVVSVSTSMYAYYQQTEATRYRTLALENEIKALEMSRIADDQRHFAENQAMIAIANEKEALKQRAIAIDQSQIAIKNAEIARRESKKAK